SAEGQVVNQDELEAVSEVISADRFVELSVKVVDAPGKVGRPETVRIGQELREYVGSLERQSAGEALLDSHHTGMVGGVAAMIAAAGGCIDIAVLRKWTQRLRHACRGSPESFESGEWSADSGC